MVTCGVGGSAGRQKKNFSFARLANAASVSSATIRVGAMTLRPIRPALAVQAVFPARQRHGEFFTCGNRSHGGLRPGQDPQSLARLATDSRS
jgi:hypothetical protein